MLYAAVVTKVNGKQKVSPWLVVNSTVFTEKHAKDPLIIIKSSMKKIRQALTKELNRVDKDGGNLMVWSQGQGVRTIRLMDVSELQVIQLDVKTALFNKPLYITETP